MIDRSHHHTTVTIDQAAAFALEQMALIEGCSIAAVLQAAISARWQEHWEAELQRRETACREADTNGLPGNLDTPGCGFSAGDTTLRLVWSQPPR